MNLDLLAQRFDENFTKFGEVGASVSVFHQGKPLLDLAHGFRDRKRQTVWDSSTVVIIWSVTKALASTTLLLLCDRLRIPLDRKVRDFWPEYGTAGKEDTTIRQVLSHQSGQPALRNEQISILDHAAVAEQLAIQTPFWPPGSAHGYHARTYGFLIDEIVRRISGLPLSDVFEQEIRRPLQLDVWLGLPPELHGRVAPLQTPRQARESSLEDPLYEALEQKDSLARKAFTTPAGLPSPSTLNHPEIWRHGITSLGAVGTAHALAEFYAHCWLEPGFFRAESLSWASNGIVQGRDQVLTLPTAFSTGFMQDPRAQDGSKLRQLFGPNSTAFGQPGMGGSHAFADPETGLSFAYVMNQMELGVFPNRKSLRLVECLYGDSI
jgi:CubicO group peptidase (beta-lactamase class C family)